MQDAARLRPLVGWLVAHKRRSNTILSSTYYIERIPQSLDGGVPGCTAGRRFVAVRPDGVVQPCHDYEASCPHSEWTPGTFAPPLDWERLKLAAEAYWVERPRARHPLPDIAPAPSNQPHLCLTPPGMRRSLCWSSRPGDTEG